MDYLSFQFELTNSNLPKEIKDIFNQSKTIYQKPEGISTPDNLKENLFSQAEK